MGDFFQAEVNKAIEYVTETFNEKGFDLIEVKELRKLNERFEMLRAMMNDSEKMEITSETAKLSLQNLKRVFFEIEDLLDEFVYHKLDLQSDRNPSITDDTIVVFRKMAERASELKAELEPIEKEWGLVSRSLKLETVVHFRSTSLQGGRDNLVGRAHSFDKIKSLLFSKCKRDKNVEVIAVLGMGGIGKTRLISSMFNNGAIEDYFGKRIWVCVSEDFSAESLTSAMLDNLGDYAPYRALDTKQRRLRENVQGKRVLLVLDDVWKVNNLNHTLWEDILKPFNFSNETKIIVTTRDEEVLKTIIKPDEIYHLPYLSDDDCFKIFKYHAFSGKEFGSYPILLELGEKISKKCRGVPLAAKSLGRLLRDQDNAEEWNEVLNNPSVCADDRDVIPILRMSYQYLPVVLKKCFRYCSVFPKGCQLNKKQLVNMWMANGFFTPSESDDFGEKYVNELLSYSLLERVEASEIFFTMHDMIHDLARSVSCDEWSSVESDMLHGHGNDGFQHISIISTKSYPQEHVQKKMKARSLLVFNSTLIWPHVKDICKNMKNLRVLDMTYSGLPAILPELIGSLKHLRFLSLQGNAITKLPESMEKLHFLETLNLNGTKIEVFPDFICSLKRLQHLDLRGTPIKFLPESLGQLDRLHSLELESCKIDRLPDCTSNMSSLRHLTCNDGVVFPLSMRKLTHLPIIKEIKDADAERGTYQNNKEQVKVLYLKWIEDCSSEKLEEMLKLSKGHHNVKQLCIEGFRGSSLPSQLNDCLCNLRVIHLKNCQSLDSLSIESIRFLRHLHIDSAKILRYIRMPVQVSLNMPQSLHIHECPSLITISSKDNLTAINDLHLTSCPEFHISRIGTCPSLRNLSIIKSIEGRNFYLGSPQPCTPELKDLSIQDHQNMESLSPSNDTDGYFSHLPQLLVLSLGSLSFIRHLCIIGSTRDIPCDFLDGRFEHLETLVLESMHFWTSWEGPKEGQCTSLQRIRIAHCSKVKAFRLSHLNEIKELHVEDCECLLLRGEWKKLLHVEKLYVSKIPDTMLVVHGYKELPDCVGSLSHCRLWSVSEVNHLIMVGCSWLRSINSEDLPSGLQAIQIHDCRKIKHICLDNQVSLKYLSIVGCSTLSTLTFGSSKLRFLEIIRCYLAKIKTFGDTHYLEYLHVDESVVLDLTDGDLLLSSIKVMEFTSPTLREKFLLDCNGPFIDEMLPVFIGRLKNLRELRIVATFCEPTVLPTIKFLKLLPFTLEVLEIIGPFLKLYKTQLPLQGLGIQKLKLEDLPYGCCIELPSTLKVLEISNCPMINMSSSNTTFVNKLHLQGSNIQHLKLEDMRNLSFASDYVPSTLRRLTIVRCPALELWCGKNKGKLQDVYITYEEEESHQLPTASSLLPSYYFLSNI